MLDVSYWHVWC